MPGTIRVSVLDFTGLPHSSPPSSISLKVSMGKKEYQTWDKGDFSFPLMTLRENLIVTLLDAEGNAVSLTGIKTVSIIEKGLLDDIFPLEGGGQVHLKLQFILSEEERNRIRIMRESALKKKHGRSEEISSTVAMPQEVELQITDKDCRELIEKIMIQPDAPMRSFKPKEDSSQLKVSGLAVGTNNNLAFPNREKNMDVRTAKKKSSQDWMTGNVRKIIGAFEHSLSQDVGSQSSMVGTEACIKDQCSKGNSAEKTKPSQLSSGRVMNYFPTRKLQQTSTYARKREGQFYFDRALDDTQPFQDMGQLESNAHHNQSKARNSSSKNKYIVPEAMDSKEGRRIPEDLMKTCAAETATVLERTINDHLGRPQLRNMVTEHQTCEGASVLENSRSRMCLIDLHGINTQGASNHNLKSLAYCEDYFESSGLWIFPDEARHVCLTTRGKNVMDVLGNCSIEEITLQRDMIYLIQEVVEEHTLHIEPCNEMNEVKQTPCELRKSNVESSSYIDASRGPVEQAIKIALIIGFGLLVLLTRQKETR